MNERNAALRNAVFRLFASPLINRNVRCPNAFKCSNNASMLFLLSTKTAGSRLEREVCRRRRLACRIDGSAAVVIRSRQTRNKSDRPPVREPAIPRQSSRLKAHHEDPRSGHCNRAAPLPQPRREPRAPGTIRDVISDKANDRRASFLEFACRSVGSVIEFLDRQFYAPSRTLRRHVVCRSEHRTPLR